jgi:hypothetical protein
VQWKGATALASIASAGRRHIPALMAAGACAAVATGVAALVHDEWCQAPMLEAVATLAGSSADAAAALAHAGAYAATVEAMHAHGGSSSVQQAGGRAMAALLCSGALERRVCV